MELGNVLLITVLSSLHDSFNAIILISFVRKSKISLLFPFIYPISSLLVSFSSCRIVTAFFFQEVDDLRQGFFDEISGKEAPSFC